MWEEEEYGPTVEISKGAVKRDLIQRIDSFISVVVAWYY